MIVTTKLLVAQLISANRTEVGTISPANTMIAIALLVENWRDWMSGQASITPMPRTAATEAFPPPR
jgi:hypothetical protein